MHVLVLIIRDDGFISYLIRFISCSLSSKRSNHFSIIIHHFFKRKIFLQRYGVLKQHYGQRARIINGDVDGFPFP